MNDSDKRKLASKLAAWKADPVSFVRELFHAEPDYWQAEFLRAFPVEQRLLLKASKGPGKTTVLSWAGWNFMLTRPHPKIICTSISGDNLKDGLWAEFRKWQAQAPLLMELFDWSNSRIVYKKEPENWFMSARTWPKDADTSQQASTLAGVHAEYVLFILDEMGRYPAGVVATAEAALSTGTETKLIAAGNPEVAEGPMYEACTKFRSQWWVKEISGDPDDPLRAKRVNLDWAKEQIDKYGRDSDIVRVNVLGKFPRGAMENIISLDAVEAARERVMAEAEWRYAAKILGVDCARSGSDRSVVQMRQGRVAFRPRVFREIDTMELAGHVAKAIEDWKPDGVCIDMDGLGAGVGDRLRELGHAIVEVHGAAKPRDQRKFHNKRAEMWFDMAEWMKTAAIPDDGELAAELVAPRRKYHSSGAVLVESKLDMKKRGLSSPDKADALAYTFAEYFAAPEVAHSIIWLNNRVGTTRHEYDPLEENRA